MNQKGLMSSTIFCPNNFRMWLSFRLGRQGVLTLCPYGWVPVCVSFTGKFSPNFNVKNMISTYTKDFSWEKSGPNSPNFKLKKFQIAKVLS
jgi:hypothetical protein